MLRITAIGILLGCLLLVTGCYMDSPEYIVSKNLGIDIKNAKVITNTDEHGKFLSDGMTHIVLEFADDIVMEQIEKDGNWSTFPADDTVQTLMYGVYDGKTRTGPILTDSNGNSLIPQIQNGYYLLIDRHTQKEENILEHYSFNFTLGAYDIDTKTLYYCKFDT